jgi:GNAT superfamily N-acetyltransferase
MLGYPTSEAQVGSRLARHREVAGAEVLVAEVDGEVAGLVAICPTQLFERDRPSCRVTSLAVRAGSRRTGVATALIEAADRAARELGCFRLEVTCRPDRPDAHAFYRSRGFQERPHRFVKEL